MTAAVGGTRSRDLVAVVLAAVCWGLGTVISKAAVAELAPLVLLPIQLAASLILLAVMLRRRGVRLRTTTGSSLARLGLLNPGIAYALGLVGLLTIGASLAVLLWAVEPIVILVLAVPFLGERPTPATIGLSVVAIAGLALVLVSSGGVAGAPIGVGLTLAGVVCCAAYTVIARRLLPGVSETSPVVFGQQVYAICLAIPLAAVAMAVGASSGFSGISAVALASAVASGVLYYAAAYWLYLGALRRLPASTASASFYLIPVVGIVASAILLGERLSAVQWVGAALVVVAVIGIARTSAPDRQSGSEASGPLHAGAVRSTAAERLP